MSYCRFGWNGSDVYFYPHADGKFVCCACLMEDDDEPGDHRYFDDRMSSIEHLEEHRDRGHTVPQQAIDRLHLERITGYSPHEIDKLEQIAEYHYEEARDDPGERVFDKWFYRWLEDVFGERYDITTKEEFEE